MTCSDEICLFLHIPKAAGTTLQSILGRNFSEHQTWVIDQYHQRGSLERLRDLPSNPRNLIRAIRGHMPFGAHEFVSGDASYVTLLRSPVDRIVSHYYYVKQSGPAHYLYEHVAKKELTLGQYASSGISPELDNGQVRLLTDTETSVAIGGITREHFERARENLVRYFSVVGTVDRFDEFLMLLRRRFRLPDIHYRKENVTLKRPGLSELPEKDREAILKWNEWDLKLYEFAQGLMSEQLEAYGPQLKRDLRAFRREQWMMIRGEQLEQQVRSILGPAYRMVRGWGRQILQGGRSPKESLEMRLRTVMQSSSHEMNTYSEKD